MSLFQRTFHRLRPSAQRYSAQCARGLEEFFETKTSVPTEQIPAGRAWEAAELRQKSFEDLHKLWYVLLKERNLLATQKLEAKRLNVEFLHKDRVVKCKKSMARIKGVLTERQLTWEEAKKEVGRRMNQAEQQQVGLLEKHRKAAARKGGKNRHSNLHHRQRRVAVNFAPLLASRDFSQMLGTMMDQNPYWLDAGFNANSATKQDLRRWLSAYGVPMPMSDLKKAALVKLWNEHVAPNREKLRSDYHTLLDAAGLSPIGNVTPARLHDVEVSASTPPPPAAAAMFAGSSTNAASAVTPRRVIRRAPADRAPWSEDDDEDDDDDDEVEVLEKKPASAPTRRRVAIAKGKPTTKAPPHNNKRRRPASPTPGPASPIPAPASPAPPVPASAGRAVTRAMARRQQQAAVPAPPAAPATPPAKRPKTIKARAKPAAGASKAAPVPAPKLRKRKAATKRQ
ncbi:39S ribosomal protein L47, mitochondrial [Allomyces arbusculus]|nr:39S ribosomal protein L47, mitochondrial [Allomyces arbusculus]